jgi:hypothetical protein
MVPLVLFLLLFKGDLTLVAHPSHLLDIPDAVSYFPQMGSNINKLDHFAEARGKRSTARESGWYQVMHSSQNLL